MPAAALSSGDSRLVALDSLRGVAAMGVALFHIDALGLIAGLSLFRQGWLFVDFFFVLSGFVIAYAYGDRLARGFSRRTFLLLRIGRIYPLHIVMVLLYLLVGITFGRPVAAATSDVGELLEAVFLLSGYATDLNYYSGASWSISVEMFAYAMAALLFGTGRKGLAIAAVLVTGAVAGRALLISVPVFTYFLQHGVLGFAAGVACFGIYRRLPIRWSPLTATLAEGVVLLAGGIAIAFGGLSDWALLICIPVFAAVIMIFAHEGGRSVESSVFGRSWRSGPGLIPSTWCTSSCSDRWGMLSGFFWSISGEAICCGNRTT